MCKTSQRTFNKSNKKKFIKVYKTMAVPTSTHGCKNLNLTPHERKAETVEVKFLRQPAGYTHTNQEIERGLKIIEIKLQLIIEVREYNIHQQ
jgi:hypothetical protein